MAGDISRNKPHTTLKIVADVDYAFGERITSITSSGRVLQRNKTNKICLYMGFPGGAVVENLPANAGDTGSSPGLGRSHMPRSSWALQAITLRQLLN